MGTRKKREPDCSVVLSDRTRSNGRKLRNMKFQLNTRKTFYCERGQTLQQFTQTHKLENPSVEIVNSCLDVVLGYLL